MASSSSFGVHRCWWRNRSKSWKSASNLSSVASPFPSRALFLQCLKKQYCGTRRTPEGSARHSLLHVLDAHCRVVVSLTLHLGAPRTTVAVSQETPPRCPRGNRNERRKLTTAVLVGRFHATWTNQQYNWKRRQQNPTVEQWNTLLTVYFP